MSFWDTVYISIIIITSISTFISLGIGLYTVTFSDHNAYNESVVKTCFIVFVGSQIAAWTNIVVFAVTHFL